MEDMKLEESLTSEVELGITSILKSQNGDFQVQSHEVNDVIISKTVRR